MRYFMYILLLIQVSFSAEINEGLFSESNASAEINKISKAILNNTSTDPQVQNQISIQKIFLEKIKALSSKEDEPAIKVYVLPNKNELTQKEFIGYFNAIAKNLNTMFMHENNAKALKKRLYELFENLKNLSPEQKNEILQGQLEYAYFKWQEIFNAQKIKQYKIYLENEKKRFMSVFLKTDVDIDKLEQLTIKQNIQLQKLYQKKVYVQLRLEKETIRAVSEKKSLINEEINSSSPLSELGNKDKGWKYNFLVNELKTIKLSISDVLKEKNKLLILRQVHNLQESDLQSYIIVREVMDSLSDDLSAVDKEIFLIEKKMLEWLKYEHIDDFTAIFYDFQAWVDKSYETTMKVIHTPLFYQNNKAIGISDFLKMFITILIGFLLARFYKYRIIALQKRVNFIQKQSFKIIGNIGYYIIIVVTFAISLGNIGLDLSSLSLVAGALSVGIGFGLKEVVGNFVSGIILMVERSVKIGDFVEIENSISGNVTDIRMRSVTIKTSSNIDVVVPNSALVQQSFTNYTLEEPVRRLSIPFTVAYGVAFEQVNDVIMNNLQESELNFVRNNRLHENEVIMTGMDERGVNYTLFVFVSSYGPNARSSFFRLVYKALLDNKLPIPSPRLEVNVDNH